MNPSPTPLSNTDTDSHPRLLKLTGLASVVVAAILIAAKFGAWLLTGSNSVLASLVDSVMDAGASVINLLAIRYALEPADDEHRFGHGKAEALAGLAQTAFIAGSAGFLIIHSVDQILHPTELHATTTGIAVMVLSIALTLGLVLLQRHTVRVTRSTAINADSLHYTGDLLVNAAVILALLLDAYGIGRADGVLALLIGFYILWQAWGILQSSIHLLLDHEVPPEIRNTIVQLIEQHPAVRGYHELRTREAGRTLFIQVHIDLDRDMQLQQAHDIADDLEAHIRERYPLADVLIHTDPV